MARTRRTIKGGGKKPVSFRPGALHAQLGVPQGAKIPAGKMAAARAGKYGPLAKKRAGFAASDELFALDGFVAAVAAHLEAEQDAKRPRLPASRLIFKKALERVQADVKAREFRDRKTRPPFRYRPDR